MRCKGFGEGKGAVLTAEIAIEAIAGAQFQISHVDTEEKPTRHKDDEDVKSLSDKMRQPRRL